MRSRNIVEYDQLIHQEWDGYDIRYVRVAGEWFAILKDICDALEVRTSHALALIDRRETVDVRIQYDRPELTAYDRTKRTQDMVAISEWAVVEMMHRSRRPEAKRFQRFNYEVLRELRERKGLEGYQMMNLHRYYDKNRPKDIIADQQERESRFDPDFVKGGER